MSRTYRNNKAGKGRRERRISIRAVRRDPPDVRKLGRALIRIAMEQAAAEADAQAGSQAPQDGQRSPRQQRGADHE